MRLTWKCQPMPKLLLLTICCFMTVFANAQLREKTANLDMEFAKNEAGLPDDWGKWGGYDITTDTIVRYDGIRSIRITAKEGENFGSCYQTIKGGFSGSQIKLSGMVRYEKVTGGHVGLLLRMDGEQGVLAFSNMEAEGLAGDADWQRLEVALPWPGDEVHSINFGGILTGDGVAWFDDLRLEIDSMNVDDMTRAPEKVYPAQLDSAFQAGSGFTLSGPGEETLDRLECLGKVWGYVKYHHADVAAGEYDLDKELFRLLDKIDDQDFDAVLINWIGELGGEKQSALPKKTTKQPYLSNRHDWMNAGGITDNLRKSLWGMPHFAGGGSHYYIGMAPGIGNPEFRHENPWPEMDFSDTGLRLLTLYRFWNMIEYFFPYKYQTDREWDTVLRTHLPEVIGAKNPLVFQQVIYRLIGEVNDTHAGMWAKPEAMTDFLPKFFVGGLPVYREGKMVISRLGDKNDCLEVGDVVLSVNGRSTEELIEHYRPYAPASNEVTVYRDIGRLLLGGDAGRAQVEVERKGTKMDLDCATAGRKWNNWFGDERRPGFELISEDIGYIYTAGLNRGEIDRVMPDNLGLKGLIVDLRNYPSNFIVFSLSKYLLPEPLPFVKFTRGSVTKPGDFYLSESLKVGESSGDKFTGKLVVLIDEFTQSQAEYTTMALRLTPNSVVVGSTTAGADGNVSGIQLPGGIRTSISGIGIYYPDGRKTQRVGIMPDVEVVQDIDAIRSGRDAQLERALKLIRE